MRWKRHLTSQDSVTGGHACAIGVLRRQYVSLRSKKFRQLPRQLRLAECTRLSCKQQRSLAQSCNSLKNISPLAGVYFATASALVYSGAIHRFDTEEGGAVLRVPESWALEICRVQDCTPVAFEHGHSQS